MSMYELSMILGLHEDSEDDVITNNAVKRISALEAELKQAQDSLTRVAEERDERTALLSDVSKWLDGWCPNATCCASSGRQLHGRIVTLLESDKKGGGG